MRDRGHRGPTKLYTDFLWRRSVLLTPKVFKGQLYIKQERQIFKDKSIETIEIRE